MRKWKALLFMSLILLITECREPFLPDFITGQNDYLVVEGFIHVGEKSVTTIKLSRVAPLQSASPIVENGATLFIEDANDTQYPLTESENGGGIYMSDSLNLDLTIEYRLLISTSNGELYASSFQKPKATPAIDSIYWRYEGGGVQIYVSAHDVENNTTYYKWDYDETWKIQSARKSLYSYAEGQFFPRSVPQIYDLFWCWKYGSAEELLFASSEQFEVDRINYPLVWFGHSSERASLRYSINVEQRALTREEFEYLRLMQKNSRITGSLFDPMPSEIIGNIESITTPDENVIGFLGAYTTQTMRIFADGGELGTLPVAGCTPLKIYPDDYERLFGSGVYIPIDYDSVNELAIGGTRFCMDCKLRGGSTKRPDYWDPE
jgi:hypothetical protein